MRHCIASMVGAADEGGDVGGRRPEGGVACVSVAPLVVRQAHHGQRVGVVWRFEWGGGGTYI